MTNRLGRTIAVGSRATVSEWGTDAVAKVPLDSTPEGWVRYEATFTDAVWKCGAPVPRVLDLITIDGREVSIFERVLGDTMWAAVRRDPTSATRYGKELAELHARVLDIRPPLTIPDQFTRLSCKLRAAGRVDPRAESALHSLPRIAARASLCHGDFHPNNVMLGSHGPIVVDWFDVSSGHAAADVARTMLLLAADQPAHLPGASPTVLRPLAVSYRAAIARLLELDADALSRSRS
jgi:aminoglycoside phosphotransferase (APT) family kinase protein